MPYFFNIMLINKKLLDTNLMIVRRVDKPFLKYIMDLGMTPLVLSTSEKNSYITFLRYFDKYTISPNIFYEERQLQKIRPLNTQEIKRFLNRCSPDIKVITISSFWADDAKIVIDDINDDKSIILTPTYIKRNILCEK